MKRPDTTPGVRLRDLFRLSATAVAARPGRSALGALALAMGVAAVVGALLLMGGLRATIDRQLDTLGGNVISVRAWTPLREALKGRANTLSIADYEAVARRVPEAVHVTPVYRVSGLFGMQVGFEGLSTTAAVLGTTASYADVHHAALAAGRFISEFDGEASRRVCVIGESVRRDLELPADPVGQYVEAGGAWCRVVGLLQPKGSVFGIDQDDVVLVPWQAGLAMAGPAARHDLVIYVSTRGPAELDDAALRITETLRQRPADGTPGAWRDDFRVETAAELDAIYRETQDKLAIVVVGVIGISLLVGGVGIMNMAYTSVAERTDQIGILKAIGATNGQVLLLFLFESLQVAVAGGLCGVLLGAAGGYFVLLVVDSFALPRLEAWQFALPLGWCVVVGTSFALIPASRAAGLAPVDALNGGDAGG
jgi:putative ABC transport system permease protein